MNEYEGIEAELTGKIISKALRIHQDLGPGMLESVYEALLAGLLEREGHKVERQLCVGFSYAGIEVPQAFRIDLLIDSRVVVELKSTEKNDPVAFKQVLTYLKVLNLQIGLVINFGMSALKDGITRVINTLNTGSLRPCASVRGKK